MKYTPIKPIGATKLQAFPAVSRGRCPAIWPPTRIPVSGPDLSFELSPCFVFLSFSSLHAPAGKGAYGVVCRQPPLYPQPSLPVDPHSHEQLFRR